MLKKIITNILLSLRLIKAKEEVKVEPVIIKKKVTVTKAAKKPASKQKAKPNTKKQKNETKQTRSKK
jgi:ribosomal protein L12E/L44/L45/RPP1/RPP2